MELKDKVAIVTGASHGIGRVIAERLGKEGAAVVVNYAGSEGAAASTVQSIESAGGEALAVQADVSDADDVRLLFEQTLQRFGRLDALINNAGWKPEDAPLAQTTESDFDKTFAVSVRGTFLCSREAVRYLPEGGRIINFASIVVRLAAPNQAAYRSPKKSSPRRAEQQDQNLTTALFSEDC